MLTFRIKYLIEEGFKTWHVNISFRDRKRRRARGNREKEREMISGRESIDSVRDWVVKGEWKDRTPNPTVVKTVQTK